MNERTTSDLDRALAIWLTDGPTSMPDRVVDVIAERISYQPQKRRWRPFGSRPMPASAKVAAAVAAVLVTVVGAWAIRPVSNAPATSPSPVPSLQSARPTPSARHVDCVVGSGCSGPVAPGEHASNAFVPTVTFTTADSLWSNNADAPANYQLDSASGYLLLWSNPRIVERTAACEMTPTPGLSNTPDAWRDYVVSHPGLHATNVHTVEVDGRSGISLDVVSTKEWQPACADDLWAKNLVQFIAGDPASPFAVYGTTWERPNRLVFLTVGQSTVLAYFSDAPSTFPLTVKRAQAVIDSLRFGP